MKQKAYCLVFNGLADWEAPHALCAITESSRFDVVSVGFTDQPVTTMGGLKIVPDITTKDVEADAAGVFILPGGSRWEQETDKDLEPLLQRLDATNVPLAAICGATLAVVRAGLSRDRRHTSNGKQYLEAMIPDYGDGALYVDALAVTDRNLVTASGLGSIEFARELITLLNLYDAADTRDWFDMHKHGVVPAKYQGT